MYYISKVRIQRFRSIMDMEFNISDYSMPVAICGQNNVGKTNTLRAINLFFNPNTFNPNTDIPELKKAQRGGSYYPKITLDFNSADNHSPKMRIIRDFSNIENDDGLKGYSLRRGNTHQLTVDEINDFISKIEFRLIKSIDVNIPKLVDDLTSDMLDIKFDKSRFVAAKKDLKDVFEKYTDLLQEILNSFSSEISDTFHIFKDNWNVSFNVPKKSDKFRDIISDDVDLKIDDKSGMGVSNKGSGLQRLAIILLNIELIKRISPRKKSSYILCIDEPDIFLHSGLQKKLYQFILDSGFQTIYTTHSEHFIDKNLRNIVFLEGLLSHKFSKRKNKEIYYLDTNIVPLNTEDGYKKICEHLGIEPVLISDPVLAKYNIIVEGECDEKYLFKLASYYGINHSEIKFIIAGGVNRINPMLDVYNSFSANQSDKPIVHVLYDDDVAGRPEYDRINSLLKNQNNFKNIDIKPFIIKNYSGQASHNGNYEIEDLMYPEIICLVLNLFLAQHNMTQIEASKVISTNCSKRFIRKGILNVCEMYTSLLNPDETLSPQQTQVNGEMCELFDISNPQIKNTLDQARIDHPNVEEFVQGIFKFE